MFYTCTVLSVYELQYLNIKNSVSLCYCSFFLFISSSTDMVNGPQIYSQQDRSKMPLELSSALSIEREPVDDPEIRAQALEAIYMITLQVN